MSIRFKYEGIEFEVSTPREAAQVVRELRRQSITPKLEALQEHAEALRAKLNERMAVLFTERANVPDAERLKTTLAFLRFLRAQGPRAIGLEDVMKALKVKAPKGLGPRSLLVNNVLQQLGFAADDVYRNQRTTQGRVWIARHRLPDAIQAIESLLDGTTEPQKELLPQN